MRNTIKRLGALGAIVLALLIVSCIILKCVRLSIFQFNVLDQSDSNIPNDPKFELRFSREPDWCYKPLTSQASVVKKYKVKGPYTVATLSTWRGPLKIYTHSKVDLISERIIEKNIWEPYLTQAFQWLLTIDPSLNLIDIGTNIGVYALIAAAYGRKVIAIDANRHNLDRVGISAKANGFEGQITTICNVVSSSKHDYKLIVYDENVGNALPKRIVTNEKVPANETIKTLYLNDLLNIIHFERAIMKIDIECGEYDALLRSEKLFDCVDVRVVVMEWLCYAHDSPMLTAAKKKHQTEFIFNLFTSRYYKPYETLNSYELDMNNYTYWPFDVLWLKHLPPIRT